MYKIAHSIILDPEIKSNISKETLDSWMILYNRGTYVRTSNVYSYLDNMWYARNVDELLEHYKKQNLDYLVINWFGVYCQDFWNWHNECIKHITSLNTKRWVLAGQVIDKEKQKKDSKYKGQFYPYPISAIINLKEWRAIGCPKWHDEDMGLFQNVIPDEECVHDDYTPLKLSAGNGQTAIDNVEPGNCFISKILESGREVYNIPIEMRKTIIHTYPENDPKNWDKTMQAYMKLPVLLDQKHFEFMKHALQYRNLRHAPDHSKGVFFLYNTEEVFPKTYKDNCVSALGEVDTILTPCSMFKAFILGSFAPNINNYVHFDIYDRNVLWKQTITETWNGTYDNLVEVLSNLPDNEEFGFWNRVEDNVIEKQYKKLLEYFGTAAELKKEWEIYQSKNHAYVKANMLFQDKAIINAVKSFEAKVIYTAIGDIPGYMINGLNYGIHNITVRTIQHLDRLKSYATEVYVDVKIPVSDYQIFDDYEATRSMLLESIIKEEY